MKGNISISGIGTSLSNFMGRYHLVIFLLTVVIGVSVAMLFLNNLITLANSNEPASVPPVTFDQKTIDRIKDFNLSGSTDNKFVLPSGRANPFVE